MFITILKTGKPIYTSRNYKLWYNHIRTMSSSAVKPNVDENLVWIDMEMTGLDLSIHRIIEVACIITDGQLNVIAEFPSLVINEPEEVLAKMNEWCVVNHAKTGLTEEVRKSKITLEEAETKLYNFISQHVPPGKCQLAGNSVYMDRLFIKQFMPRIDGHLHYRIVDVSAVKELCRRWYPSAYERMVKNKLLAHRAFADIKNSIEELKYYRSTIFKESLS
ncbi:LOW QUALITY PROTEIN: probable oligoribonuclease [Nilaparvata lugens]|uniref:LOW QUALITY PROTEIN: probable oligoribonuclease n=1 Tax=Nilaparvata lugens TaxID=108931 RepID=UPI00193C8867|nr:LOW QUALITY PROTEIN: probable oligoribonuclease [Nilaparvata lugens]